MPSRKEEDEVMPLLLTNLQKFFRHLRNTTQNRQSNSALSILLLGGYICYCFLSFACEELLHKRSGLVGAHATDNLGLWVHDIGGIAVIAAFLVLGTID